MPIERTPNMHTVVDARARRARDCYVRQESFLHHWPVGGLSSRNSIAETLKAFCLTATVERDCVDVRGIGCGAVRCGPWLPPHPRGEEKKADHEKGWLDCICLVMFESRPLCSRHPICPSLVPVFDEFQGVAIIYWHSDATMGDEGIDSSPQPSTPRRHQIHPLPLITPKHPIKDRLGGWFV